MLAVLIRMRQNSTRLSDKMLKRVGGRSLAERIISRCLLAGWEEGAPVYAFLSSADEDLCRWANILNCHIIFRSDRSAAAPDAQQMCDAKMIEDLTSKRIDRVLFPSACFPFLTVSTIREYIVRARSAERQFITAYENQGWVFNQRGEKIHGPHTSSKREGEPYKTICSAFFYAPVDVLGEPEMLDFELVTVPNTPEFLIDVDTQDDLEMARAWDCYQNGGRG